LFFVCIQSVNMGVIEIDSVSLNIICINFVTDINRNFNLFFPVQRPIIKKVLCFWDLGPIRKLEALTFKMGGGGRAYLVSNSELAVLDFKHVILHSGSMITFYHNWLDLATPIKLIIVKFLSIEKTKSSCFKTLFAVLFWNRQLYLFVHLDQPVKVPG
jgi:hypothetical protein